MTPDRNDEADPPAPLAALATRKRAAFVGAVHVDVMIAGCTARLGARAAFDFHRITTLRTRS
jgi:hypothetical protein